MAPRGGAAAYDADRAMAEMPELPAPTRADARPTPPDIYHFVFDRYGSEETLARHYGIGEPIGALPRKPAGSTSRATASRTI